MTENRILPNSRVRENIVDWLPTDGTEQVLEITAGTCELTDALARKTAKVTVSTIEGLQEQKDRYDLITLVGQPEALAHLDRIRDHLAPGGRILLTVDNRLGLRYFAGEPEEKTGIYFEGLEGYPETGEAFSFSKQELEALLREAGFDSLIFYYPYPDYRTPERIYSDRYLPKKGELNRNDQPADEERIRLFNEEFVFDSLTEFGQFPQFSNSFLVIASEGKRTEPVLYEKFSNERALRFGIRTEIGENAGERYIRKVPGNPEADAHISGIYTSYLLLSEDLKDSGIRVNPCEKADGEVRLAYREGPTLEERLDEKLSEGNIDALEQEIEEYFDLFAREGASGCAMPFRETEEFKEVFGSVKFETPQTCRAVSDIDMIFSNVIETEDGPELIDYEWTFSFPVPVRFLLYRCLRYYVYGTARRAVLIDRDLFGHFGISQEEQKLFAGMEAHFQAYMLGDCTPLWKQREGSDQVTDLSGLIRQKKEWTLERRAELYFDTGTGFAAVPDQKIEVSREGPVETVVRLPEKTEKVRLDPCGFACVVRITELSQDGRILPVTSNGLCAENGDLIFDTEDPQIYFETEGSTPVTLKYLAEPLTGLTRETILSQYGTLAEIKDSRLWRGYEQLKHVLKKD